MWSAESQVSFFFSSPHLFQIQVKVFQAARLAEKWNVECRKSGFILFFFSSSFPNSGEGFPSSSAGREVECGVQKVRFHSFFFSSSFPNSGEGFPSSSAGREVECGVQKVRVHSFFLLFIFSKFR
jgi:hypothetical protein